MHDKRIYIREKDLLKPVYEIFEGIKLPDNKAQELVEDLKQAAKAENRFFANSVRELRRHYDKLENRISRLADDKYDGCVTEDFYNKKFKEYTEKQSKLMTEMNLHDKADKQHYITANTVLSLAQRAKEVFESSEVDEKRQLLNFLLQNLKLKGRKLLFDLKTPFDTVFQANRCSDWLPSKVIFRTLDWDMIAEELKIFKNTFDFAF